MPNLFAYTILVLWPVVAVVFFQRFSKPLAVILAILVPYMLLPERTSFDFPVIPEINKTTLANVMVVVLILVIAGAPLRLMPRGPVLSVIFLCLIGGTVMTSMTNTDWLVFGPTVLPGLGLYDAASQLMATLLIIAPFLAGRSVLGTVESHRLILKVLVFAGLIYSLPMLFEVRMSPQLHTWIYGFFPHDFTQQMRAGGFRPVVFMQHGLWVAFFTMTTVIAAAILWRAGREQPRGLYLGAVGYLFAVLILCKSLGSLMFAVLLLPMVLLLGRRLQMLIACAMVVTALLYPALRGAGLVPIDRVIGLAEAIDEARAQSFVFRVENEEQLLVRAEERALFGWGGYNRNLIYDPITGRTFSVTDGYWIIIIGQKGWIGYIAIFGLLAWPILAVRFAGREPPPLETTGLCLILGVNMIELLPNASVLPTTWLIAGALFGYAENGAPAAATDETPETAEPDAPRIRTVI